MRLLTVALALTATGVAAGEVSTSNGMTPQPYARVRVAISPDGGRAEIRETASDATPSVPSPSYQPTTATAYGGVSPYGTTEPAPASPTDPAAPAVLAVLYGKDITEADVVRELLERRGRETLEWLIGRDILRHELDRLSLQVKDGEVEERLAKHLEGFRKAFPNLSAPEDLVRAASGMHLDEYRERAVWAELALRKIMRVALRPSTSQLRGYYAERQFEFIQPERIRISQVFIAPQPDPDTGGLASEADWAQAQKQILEAHSRLRMGEDFAAVARAYGTGGQLSRWVGRGELLRELEEAAFAIKEGSHTAPLKSSMGYHIINVEKIQKRKVPPFEEVREEVLAQYEEMQFLLRAGEFMARLRDKALRNGGLVFAETAEADAEAGADAGP